MDDQQKIEAAILRELDGISPVRQAFDRRFLGALEIVFDGVVRHWLLIANLTNGLIIGGAVAVPAMRALGWVLIPDFLFAAYHLICEQRPERSYFLWGYQMAVDQRITAIFGSSLLAGLAFIPLQGRIRPISWRTFFLLCVPMAVDGFTQLFGWRESNWELRTITGVLVGGGMVWLVYPCLWKPHAPR